MAGNNKDSSENPFDDFFDKEVFGNLFKSELFSSDFLKSCESFFSEINKKTNLPGAFRSERAVRDMALIETFRKETMRGDLAYLKQAIEDYSEDVLREETNDDLVRAYILASLTVEDLNAAAQGFRFIGESHLSDSELEGLVQFNRGLTGSAISLFRRAGNLSRKSRIAYSAALQKNEDLDLQRHYALLNPLVNTDFLANTLLGTVYYNVGDYVQAEPLFKKARELKQSERTFLDYLRVQKRLGNEVYGELNDFYISTRSNLGQEELSTQLDLTTVSVPNFQVMGLGKLALSLWE